MFIPKILSEGLPCKQVGANMRLATQVFGNSNSLPISLVISLSNTLKGLHWDKIPGDNDDEVAARGILYLLIFQQLGQLVRWSWGYHVLLAPKEKYEEYNDERAEEGRFGGDAISTEETDHLLHDDETDDDASDVHRSSDSEIYEPAGRTPVVSLSRTSLADLDDRDGSSTMRKHSNGKHQYKRGSERPSTAGTINNEDADSVHNHSILSFPRIRSAEDAEEPVGIKGRANRWVKQRRTALAAAVVKQGQALYARLPRPLQSTVDFSQRAAAKVNVFLWEFMNPPLWAMLIAVIVASVPDLQRLFFEEGSFVKNSVTTAVSSSAGVAVPLILVVLGANLARSTQQREDEVVDPEEAQIGTKLLVASLICRMLLPTLIMAPILAVFAKYVPVSILDDPIFVIVCFLLVGAPSALQLAQICQINSVYENVMSKVLFQSYVIW